jgi:hypothetical protein
MVAVFEMEATTHRGSYNYGASHWNALIFNYVPAQIVGTRFKASLMLAIEDAAYQEYGFTPPTGATQLGMSHAFQAFWYFGAIEFLVVSFVMARLWRTAQNAVLFQLWYACILADSLHSITHQVDFFFTAWIHMGLFLLPSILLSARLKSEPTRFGVVPAKIGK